jgi:TetR/AcrR family transcriptional regulator
MNIVNDSRTATLRLPASDRRRQLVETALDFFSRKGFGGTTTKEIAAAAGVTEAIIFRHFPTKSDLYNAVLDHHHDSGRISECIAQWKNCMERNDDVGLVRSIIEKIIEAYRRDLRGHRVLLFAALEGHEIALEHNRQISFPIFELLCQYVARRQSEGAIRQGSPGAIVAAVAGMATHYATMTQMFGFSTNSSDRQMADSFVDIVMHGIQETKTLKGHSK